jgi:hypothetical protein
MTESAKLLWHDRFNLYVTLFIKTLHHLRFTIMICGSVQDKYNEVWMEEVWRLYYALTNAVEHEQLPLLDQLEFSDFIKLCRKHTSMEVAKQGEERIAESMLAEDGNAEEVQDTPS